MLTRFAGWFLAALVPAASPLPLAPSAPQAPGLTDATAPHGAAPAVLPPLLLPRGEGDLDLAIPRDEELVFRARIRLGPVESRVGTITISSGVEPYRPSVLFGGGGADGDKETAWVRAHAVGSHTFYSMDSLIESRFQPQAWPAMVNSFTQKGTEQRRRELLVGQRDGQSVRSYRSDASRGAPAGTRIWRPARVEPCPPHALDSISAVFLLRSMLAAEQSELEFPMLDKERVWWVHAELGDGKVVETPAGAFDARPVRLGAVRLDLARWAEQIAELERPDAPDPDFEGPFGIRGDIRLWVHAKTGVPVWIEGDLPLGIVTLELDIRLERYRGTPTGFAPKASE